MAIKDIVTLLDLNGEQPAAQVAIEFARQIEAHVTGVSLVLEPIVPGFIAAPMPADYLQMAHKQAVDAASTASGAFDRLVELAGVNGESRQETVITGGSLEPILQQARMTDVVVVGQDNPEQPEPMREVVIESLLFESGVPTLLVPYISQGKFSCKNVVVAWDGSPTAARAVHAALPILEMAEKVTIVIVNKGKPVDGEPGADLATYLARHNLKVTVDVITKPPVSVADSLLNYVSENDVDMLVMGGYGHSRMREYIIGGATRDILSSMTVPVLMAH
ncbi:universal stress protein [Polycladidibacter hongkongensis]|uniref:universal stress protein n=1 Tax=Polycladidibacter hongkongensis TaxID=1647556 RepID=UPI000833BEFB|nr:universal stress protein [Pseudovibrio hongkongensis]